MTYWLRLTHNYSCDHCGEIYRAVAEFNEACYKCGIYHHHCPCCKAEHALSAAQQHRILLEMEQ